MVAVNTAVAGLINGCMIDLSVLVDLNLNTCPSIDVKLPYGLIPVSNGELWSLEKSADKRAVACPSMVTVDPFNPPQPLSTEDTVNLQLVLGVLDLINVDAGLQLDLAGLLDLMVRLNINLLDLVNLDLDLNVGLGRLLDSLLRLNLDVTVGNLLDLNLNLDVDLAPLLDNQGGRDAPVILGDVLNLLQPSPEKAPGVISEILSSLTPVVSGLLDTVGGILGGLLGKRQTAEDVISMAMARRRGYAYSSEASPENENGTGSGDQPTGSNEGSTSHGATTTTAAATVAPTVKPVTSLTGNPATSTNGPTHPINLKPNCGTCLAPSAPNVVEVEVTDLTECVNQCHLTAAGGLVNVLLDANVNVLNVVNIDLCLAVSILGTSSAGTQTCRYITGTGVGSTAPSSAFQSVADCITYEKA